MEDNKNEVNVLDELNKLGADVILFWKTSCNASSNDIIFNVRNSSSSKCWMPSVKFLAINTETFSSVNPMLEWISNIGSISFALYPVSSSSSLYAQVIDNSSPSINPAGNAIDLPFIALLYSSTKINLPSGSIGIMHAALECLTISL